MLKLGEPEAAIYNFEQALVFYPENAEIEYRLGGLFYTIQEKDKGLFHLKNGLKNNSEFSFIIDELFPELLANTQVKTLINSAS